MNDQEKAAASCIAHKFQGKTLFPFTPQRQQAACVMGLKWITEPNYVQKFWFGDTILAIWLCVIPDEAPENKWSVDRAEVEPKAATKEAYKWAKQVGIAIGSNAFTEAFAVWAKIVKELKTCKGEPVTEEEATRDADDPDL